MSRGPGQHASPHQFRPCSQQEAPLLSCSQSVSRAEPGVAPLAYESAAGATTGERLPRPWQ
eukprot:15215524-Alexandrium_andersonii.AAC.1